MAVYKIQGGIELNGEVTPVPNKNSILKLIPASLLTDEPVIIHNVPKSSDVRIMLKIVKTLGGKVTYFNNGTSVKIVAKGINTYKIDEDLSQKAKASVMFMAPLLHRFGKAEMPIPGGCKLGSRPLDAFIDNMVQLGAVYRREKGYFLEAKKLKGAKVWSWFPSVTGTENLINLAVLTPGVTEIYNAACEPHTQDLCNMLVSMGAKIKGIGSNKLVINGVDKLKGTEWNVISDHLDIAEYMAIAAVTGSELTINNAIPEHMTNIRSAFEKINLNSYYEGDKLIIPKNQKLKAHKTVRGDLFQIMALHWPQFPPDAIQSLVVAACFAEGSLIFHNSFYEYGFYFIEELAKLKANVVMADPHRVITFGPSKLEGTVIKAPNIIASAKALFVAALGASGVSTLIDETDQLSRRYPELVETYLTLGAQIEKVK
ncbi:MAG: UDP-N-acetylglucosamine 1-carboxyvinyltransferase [Candidatus Dojkabacteria bacterium]|nr:MAG: UDP-N-acetylglucosamine 1-carboxyvinyltransferase [Candidatus Dojkabacteria bacterium]